MDRVVRLSSEDCGRGVHYYQCGLYARNPECHHTAQYKECKNCAKVVWTTCERCEQLTIMSEKGRRGGEAKVKSAVERGRELMAALRSSKPQNER